jgi:hypothetical protein
LDAKVYFFTAGHGGDFLNEVVAAMYLYFHRAPTFG